MDKTRHKTTKHTTKFENTLLSRLYLHKNNNNYHIFASARRKLFGFQMDGHNENDDYYYNSA